jgi:hypothetical protein
METITIQLSKDDAAQLENFLRGFMSTYKFAPPSGGIQRKALNNLHIELRKALDAAHSK